MRPATRLLIFTTSPLRGEAWRALLAPQPAIEVMRVVNAIPGAAGTPPATDAAAIFVDISIPDVDHVRQLRRGSPRVGLLFLVPSYDLTQILPLLQAGATGFVDHNTSVADLARAIIAVGRRELVLPPQIAARALAALARGDVAPTYELMEPLTAREREVLGLLAQGLTNKDIAQNLFVSVRTVEAHLRNVYGKLGVRSRTEAALWAVEHGISGGTGGEE